MRIATWNVNSIRARLSRLLEWLERSKPDVVCLQETKVEDALFPEIEIRAAGYHAALHGQKTYNGVAILSRLDLSDVVVGMGDGVEDAQARLCAATAEGVRIVSIYAPNGRTVGSPHFEYKLAWYARLGRWLEAHADPARPLVLAGDFNVAPEPIDVHDPAEWEGKVMFHPDERAALRRLVDWGLVDLYRRHHAEGGRFTWWDYRQLSFPKGRGLRIDHLLGTAPVATRTSAAEILRDMRKGKDPSDHAPVEVTLL